MSTLFLVWTGQVMMPAYESDLEVCQRFKQGTPIKIEAKQSRSNPMNALFWALMGYAWRSWPKDGAGTFRDSRALVDALLGTSPLEESIHD